MSCVPPLQVAFHAEGHLGEVLRMFGDEIGETGNGHVGVADRLDPLARKMLDDPVKGRS
jgi:hypothetical protein